MGRYRVTGSFTCEGNLHYDTPDEEALGIFKKHLQALLRHAFNEDVTITIIKCERIKEEDNGNKG